jgi:hypothetical protein
LAQKQEVTIYGFGLRISRLPQIGGSLFPRNEDIHPAVPLFLMFTEIVFLIDLFDQSSHLDLNHIPDFPERID